MSRFFHHTASCRFRDLFVAFCLTAILFPANTWGQNPESPEIRFHGAKIRVSDMDAARTFYSEKLGFTISWTADEGSLIALDAEPPVYLAKAETMTPADPGMAGAAIVLHTSDIEALVRDLQAKGIKFKNPVPQKNGVGVDVTFYDPFGTRISVMEERTGRPGPEQEPAIYNMGYTAPDVAAQRPLYLDGLGFVVRTEDYFPPALPLGHRDGSFAFMLHQKNVDLGPATYPGGTGTTLVFSTADLDAARTALEDRGLEFLNTQADEQGGMRFLAFRDPAGIVSELWEQPHQ